jgi:signal peptidase I
MIEHETVNYGGADFFGLADEILSKGKRLRFRARGGSMYPSIKNGDLVEVQPVQPSALRRGDLVLYHSGGNRLVVHRVMSKSIRSDAAVLVTKGDSVRVPDSPVHQEEVLGRVVAIYKGGRRVQVGTGLGRLTSRLWVWLSPLIPHCYRLPRVARHVMRRLVNYSY